MLKTNQGEIQDGKSYKLPPELRKLANERDCAVSSDRKNKCRDFPVCHCRGEIWPGSEIQSDINIQDASNRDDEESEKLRIILESVSRICRWNKFYVPA